MKKRMIGLLALGLIATQASARTWVCSSYTMGVTLSDEYQGTTSANELAMMAASEGICIYDANTGVCPQHKGVYAQADSSYGDTGINKSELYRIAGTLENPSGIEGKLEYKVDSDGNILTRFYNKTGGVSANFSDSPKLRKTISIKQLYKFSALKALYVELTCSTKRNF